MSPWPTSRNPRYRNAMKPASLIAFLAGSLSPDAFAAEIAREVDAFRASIRTTRQGQIVLTDGPETLLTRDHARRLVQAVIDKALSFEAANYIADAIIMSDSFDWDDDVVGEALHLLADDHPPPTEDDVRCMLGLLG